MVHFLSKFVFNLMKIIYRGYNVLVINILGLKRIKVSSLRRKVLMTLYNLEVKNVFNSLIFELKEEKILRGNLILQSRQVKRVHTTNK